MTRRCDLTGVAVMRGNNVSHSHQKTKRRFLPNLQKVTVTSDILGRKLRMRVTTNALKTLEVKGGLDSYLLGASDDILSFDALTLKKQIKKAKSNLETTNTINQ